MSVQYGLFGNVYLIRQWGRIGTRGRKLIQSFDTMDEEIQRLLDIRKRRGYNLREYICNVCKKKITTAAKQLRIDGSEIEVCPVCYEMIE